MLNPTLVTNTIQKEIRNKGIIFLFVFAIGFLFAGHKLAIMFNVNFGNEATSQFFTNTSQQIIVYFLTTCSNIVAIILASTIVRSDMSSRVLPQILSFPVTRFEYLFSRVFGAWVITIAFYLLCLIFGVGLLITSGSIELDFFSLISSFLIMSIELVAIILICTFISLYGNRLVSFIFSVVIYFLSGAYTERLYEYDGVTLGKLVNYFMYYFTPRLGEMTKIAESFIAGKTFAASQLSVALLHFIATTSIWFFIMKTLFDKKEA